MTSSAVKIVMTEINSALKKHDNPFVDLILHADSLNEVVEDAENKPLKKKIKLEETDEKEHKKKKIWKTVFYRSHTPFRFGWTNRKQAQLLAYKTLFDRTGEGKPKELDIWTAQLYLVVGERVLFSVQCNTKHVAICISEHRIPTVITVIPFETGNAGANMPPPDSYEKIGKFAMSRKWFTNHYEKGRQRLKTGWTCDLFKAFKKLNGDCSLANHNANYLTADSRDEKMWPESRVVGGEQIHKGPGRRQTRGPDRQVVKMKLEHKTPMEVTRDLLNEKVKTSEKNLKQGNYDGTMTSSAVKIVMTEINSALKKHDNPFVDLILHADSLNEVVEDAENKPLKKKIKLEETDEKEHKKKKIWKTVFYRSLTPFRFGWTNQARIGKGCLQSAVH
ncbi:Arginine biosynthesis bifunctional protein ArgJ [Frankliniella fusca]|uniref:Arginine biosynthesis bifunctional protein ArgJ n=1 Tax=Frankliniella fusca TaxID=407009 RepID=A0AAE1GX54_9NEOP|nr:Arginine biosynthesis bifunctional protein ArgJ [Frankliniella fusca]